MSQGHCTLPECKGYCCAHLDKRITQLESELQSANNRVRELEMRLEQTNRWSVANERDELQSQLDRALSELTGDEN